MACIFAWGCRNTPSWSPELPYKKLGYSEITMLLGSPGLTEETLVNTLTYSGATELSWPSCQTWSEEPAGDFSPLPVESFQLRPQILCHRDKSPSCALFEVFV